MNSLKNFNSTFKFVLFFLLILFSSCSKKDEEIIQFENTYPLALALDVQWAVVTDPYAAFRLDFSWNSDSEGHARRGEILQIKGNSLDENGSIWYKFDGGWLNQSSLSVYSNRFKAKTASENLLKTK